MSTAVVTRSLTAAVRQHLTDLLSQEIDTELTTTDLNFVLSIVTKTDDAVEAVQREEQRILMDGNASDQGKSKALAALADRSCGSFGFLERIVTQHEKEIADVERKLYARLRAPENEPIMERLVRELRAGEIRSSLDGTPADVAFLEALQQDKFEVVLAMLTNPTGPMVSDEIVQRGKVAFAKRVDLASLAGMKSLSIVRDRIQGILEFVKTWLLRLGAAPATIERHLSV